MEKWFPEIRYFWQANESNMENTRILIKIRKIIRSINLESKKIQKEYGVSIPQVLCLNYLKQSPEFQSSQHLIREFLNLNSSTVTGIIGRLEKKGLVARLPKSGDRRITNIALTSRGDEVLRHMPSLMHDRLTEKLDRYDPDQVQKVETALDLIVAFLDIESLDASPLITDDILEDEGLNE